MDHNSVESFMRMINPPKPKFQIVETTDMRNGSKTYKIYPFGKAGKIPPLVAGIATREEAEAKVRELEGNIR